MTSRGRRKGKQSAAESSGGNSGSYPIDIVDQACTLIIKEPIPGTPLFRALCEGIRCTALSKTLDNCYHMHNILNDCQHTNLLKSIGFWPDPRDESKAYIVVDCLDNALSSLEKEQLFHIESGCICGFSEFGYKVFREIFLTIDYINTCYKDNATPSMGLFPMMLEPNNIFFQMVNGEARIKMGNFEVEPLATWDALEAAHWNEAGRCLRTLFGTDEVTAELNALANFLTQGNVTYQDLLWQPGIWNAATKMQFIREIFWCIDVERDPKEKRALSSIHKARKLMRKNSLDLLDIMEQFSPPKDNNEMELRIKDDHLFDSVIFLRNKILAHYAEEYPLFKGDKNEIGITEESREWYIRKRKPEYMINLAGAIRDLGWIPDSPIIRGDTYYMRAFAEMKIKHKCEASTSR